MLIKLSSTPRSLTIYLIAWLVYISFAIFTFPAFSISVMLFSVALAMFGAWYYGFTGAIVTTLLTIPFHMLLLYYYDSWETALNPFGISTQLLASGSIALLRQTKFKLERLNKMLEDRVKVRTKELSLLQHYIIQSQESAQILLSSMLLGDIRDSLTYMMYKSDKLLSHLVFEENPACTQASRLNDMIRHSLELIEKLEFVDPFFSDQHADFLTAVVDVTEHLKKTDLHFNLDIHPKHPLIPKQVQHQLYRIAQEAVTNAIRHAKASNIWIKLNISNEHYSLSITNDGHPMPAKVKKGLGLRLMQHRAEQLDGSLSWNTTVERRTRLLCTIPSQHD